MNSASEPKTTAPRTSYCIDSSALMNLGRHFVIGARPYALLWKNIDSLIEDDRLVAPDEVLSEIERGRDDLVRWARQHRSMFLSPTPDVVEEVTRLAGIHGHLFAGVGRGGLHADPWVVGLAVCKSTLIQTAIVVCDEKRVAGRVPSICDAEGIPCVDHTQWFDREGWGFT